MNADIPQTTTVALFVGPGVGQLAAAFGTGAQVYSAAALRAALEAEKTCAVLWQGPEHP